jgi:hypothetical protein
MKKPITILLCIIVVLLLLTGSWAWQWSRNVLVIQNESGKTVDVVTVTVCGKSYRVENLPIDGTSQLVFDVMYDSGFQVDVTFDDGSELTGNVGYVTGGAGAYNNRAKVIIREQSIEGTQGD